MTSKVLVKLPVVPFQQRKKPPAEVAPLPSSRGEQSEQSEDGRFQAHSADRVTQLEQNLQFLQEQQQKTLLGLHQEVDLLRQRNRDLQFQLVFSKGASGARPCSSPSSPEDGSASEAKQVSPRPLRLELLERELQEARAAASEVGARNERLSEALDQQKQKLQLLDRPRAGQKHVAVQAGGQGRELELRARLDEAEALVRRLRLEADERRRESAQPARDEAAAHRFPPLHTHGYWQRAPTRAAHSYEHRSAQPDYRRGGRQQQQHQQLSRPPPDAEEGVLPQLLDASAGCPTFFRQTHHNGGNYHRDEQQQQQQQQQQHGGYRKYRGKKTRKEFGGQERRPFHSQHFEPKDQQQSRQPFADSCRPPRRHPS